MDFQALRVLQDQVERLAGSMMMADLDQSSEVDGLLEQIHEIAKRAEEQGLNSEAELCRDLLARFRTDPHSPQGTWNSA
jgi:hypothetical protein